MCLVRSIIIATCNLCPIMIHFSDLDFNVCRSEEAQVSFDAQCIYWKDT